MGKRITPDTGQGAKRRTRNHLAGEPQAGRNLVEAITQAMPDLVTIYDITTGALIYSNQEQLVHGRVHSNEIRAVDWVQLGHYTIDPEENHRVATFLRKRLELQDDEILEMEFKVRDTGGEPGWIRVRSKVFKRDKPGKPLQIVSFTTNITAEKNTELQLQESREELSRRATDKYETLFKSIDEGYALCELIQDADGRVIDARYLEVNPAFGLLTGLENAAGKTMRELNPNIEPVWLETSIRVVETGQPIHKEEYSPGLGRWFDAHYSRVGPTRDRTFALVLSNITERKCAEQALRESEARLRRALEIETVGIIFFQPTGEITYANDAFLRMSGYTRADTENGLVRWDEMTPPEFMPQSLNAIDEFLKFGRTTPYEKQYIRKDGVRRWALFAATRINDQEGVEFITDITERKEAEQARQQAHDELEQRVAKRTRELAHMSRERQVLLQELLNAQEAERRRLAREMHDQLGQSLTALSLELQALRSEHRSGDGVAQRVAVLEDLLRQTAETVQSLAFELRPPALDDLGLSKTLQNFLEDWAARFGLDVQCQMTGLEFVRLPADIEIALYRIVQEALTNIVRHAAATHVSVILERREGQATAIIEDDGRGFDLEQVTAQAGATHPLGLIGMRERAALVGGMVEIESAPGAGTTVFVRIPLRSES